MGENELALEVAKLVLKAKESDHWGDLIKIGVPLIGAIIVAWIGYHSAKNNSEIQKSAQLEVTDRNNKAALLMEHKKLRQSRFESLIDHLDTFSRKLTNHTTNIKNWIEDTQSGKEITGDYLNEVKECEIKFKDSFLDLLSAEAKLLVSGEASLQKDFRAFGVKAQDLFKEVHIGNNELTVERINGIMKEMQSKREQLLEKIGRVEREHNN